MWPRRTVDQPGLALLTPSSQPLVDGRSRDAQLLGNSRWRPALSFDSPDQFAAGPECQTCVSVSHEGPPVSDRRKHPSLHSEALTHPTPQQRPWSLHLDLETLSAGGSSNSSCVGDLATASVRNARLSNPAPEGPTRSTSRLHHRPPTLTRTAGAHSESSASDRSHEQPMQTPPRAERAIPATLSSGGG